LVREAEPRAVLGARLHARALDPASELARVLGSWRSLALQPRNGKV
jgi:hypothetical protein